MAATQNSNPFTTNAQGETADPFAPQREESHNFRSFFKHKKINTATSPAPQDAVTPPNASPVSPSTARRFSGETGDEWDASKTPPSRFQQRKGSIYATPNSRDGHVDRNLDRDHKYHELLAQKGWGNPERRGSKASH